MEPKIAETCSWRSPGPNKNYIDRLLAGPRLLLREVSALPFSPGSPPSAEQAFLRAPRGLQEPPGPLQEASRTQFLASGTLRKSSNTAKKHLETKPPTTAPPAHSRPSFDAPRPGGMREAIKLNAATKMARCVPDREWFFAGQCSIARAHCGYLTACRT